jgi:hypothetical protein
VFNVDQLYLVANNPLPSQIVEPLLPVLVEQTLEYEVTEVLDYRRKSRGF